MKPWWERWPYIYQREIDALNDAGISFVVNEKAKRQGRIVLELTVGYNGQPIALSAHYPANFPYTRFYLYSDDLKLPRHQSPLDGQLCLIPKATTYWKQGDTLAAYIVERLPKVIEVATSTDETLVRREEEPQGEPHSAYYAYAPNAGIILPATQLPCDAMYGNLTLGWAAVDRSVGIVVAVEDDRGNALAKADSHLVKRYPTRGKGKWVRLAKPPRTDKTLELLRLAAVHPKIRTAASAEKDEVIALIFPEEVQQGVMRDGWLFVRRQPAKLGPTYCLVRAMHGASSDLQARVPELRPIATKKVSVFGLGCLGASSALQFARNGVGELRLLDFDFVEPGTTVRWPYGATAWGKHKSQFIGERIQSNYPFVDTRFEQLMIGDPNQGPLELDVLERMLYGADLVYDATAEWGIDLLLARLAQERGIPYVWVSTTNGVWGGIVGRVIPGKTEGCFCCYGHHLYDKTIPLPHQAPVMPYQPVGCSDVTFPGISFDAENIVVAGVRLSIATLCDGNASAYPDASWDIGILNLRNADGTLAPPSWSCHRLTKHPKCPQHG